MKVAKVQNKLKSKNNASLLGRQGLVSCNQNQGKIFVISGPSGSGKTTLLTSLIQNRKIGKILVRSCSITTRPKRSGEREAKEYFFVTSQEFKRLLKTKKILEWTRYLGYYYGTPKEALEKQLNRGKHVGLCLDLKGARILKKLYPKNTVTIFVLPPSLSVLRERIQKRSRYTQEQEVAQRMLLARSELKAAGKFDYCILNQNLTAALKELKKIFLQEISV